MSSPENHVIVGLTFEGQDPDMTHTERRIRLDTDHKTVQLGRTSKRDPNLTPDVGNGWIDSPVISREHAELSLGDQSQAVYIKDLNSRHGTYLNHERLEPHRAYPLMPGDVLKLGTDIQRMDKSWPPQSAEVFIDVRFPSPSRATPPQARQGVFVVPDDSDSSDCSDDDVEAVSEVRYAVKALREVAGARHPRLESEASQVLSQLAQRQGSPVNDQSMPIEVEDDEEPTPAKTEAVVINLDDEDEEPKPASALFVDLTDADDTAEALGGLLAGGAVTQRAETTTQQADLTQAETAAEEIVAQPAGEVKDLPCSQNEGFDYEESDEDANVDSQDDSLESDDSCLDSSLDGEGRESVSEDDIDLEDDDNVVPDGSDWDSDEELGSVDVAIWDGSRFPEDSPRMLPLSSGALLDPPAPWSEPDAMETHEDTDMERTFLEVKEYAAASETARAYNRGADHLPPQPQRASKDCFDLERIPTTDRFPSGTTHAELGLVDSPVGAQSSGGKWQGSSPTLPGYQTLASTAGTFSGMAVDASSEYRLRLPPILNDYPSKSSSGANSPPTNQSSQTGPALASVAAGGNGVFDKTADTQRADEAHTVHTTAMKEVATVVTQLAPQSPLTESGEKFLSYPPKESSEEVRARDSPELDMSSARLSHQSRMNHNVSERAVLSKEKPQKTTTRPLDPDAPPFPVEREDKAIGTTKRKAAEISDATESEEAQQKAMLDTPLLRQERQPSLGVDAALAGLQAKYEADRAPKRVRRMVEAARLVALGGAAAGVALFTTLVATAPSF